MQTNDITKSIVKTYRKTIWKKTIKAIDDYKLIKENDKVAVCISGGKDSFLLAVTLKEIQRHYKVHFDLEYLCMNPGYSSETLNLIKENALKLNIPLKIFETNIFEEIKGEESPCYVCARKRRGYLYNKAKELGCNKIALGHHFDDVIETIMINMLYAGTYGSMLPKLHSEHYSNMELIRPLYLVKEYDIKKWCTFNNLNFINCACDVTKKQDSSKRAEIKELINNLRKVYKDVDKNIFKASENINLNTVLGYIDSKKHSFLDEYDKK
jgi:tRNA 2-thiocytidine biosynthesis protein TtcA